MLNLREQQVDSTRQLLKLADQLYAPHQNWRLQKSTTLGNRTQKLATTSLVVCSFLSFSFLLFVLTSMMAEDMFGEQRGKDMSILAFLSMTG